MSPETKALVKAAASLLAYYDGLGDTHHPGEAAVLDALEAALTQPPPLSDEELVEAVARVINPEVFDPAHEDDYESVSEYQRHLRKAAVRIITLIRSSLGGGDGK